MVKVVWWWAVSVAVGGEDADGKRTVGSGSGSVLGHGGLRYKFSAVSQLHFSRSFFGCLQPGFSVILPLCLDKSSFRHFHGPSFRDFRLLSAQFSVFLPCILCHVFRVLKPSIFNSLRHLELD